jgi:putative endonuclease
MLNLFQHPSRGNHPRMPIERAPCVYILASQPRGTLYIGVTSDLMQRLYQHREGLTGGFTARYKVHRLVRFEMFGDMEGAILREKQLKRWHRQWKINLIEGDNPHWIDLAIELGFEPLASDEPKNGS